MPTAAGLYYYSHNEDDLSRPPVILIHGAGGTHLHWPPDIRRMDGPRIYAIDLPGHGKSSGLGEQSIDEYTGSVVEFMNATGLHAAVVVGHSMGSAIAITLTIEHPNRVRGLGLVGSGARLRVAQEILDGSADLTKFQQVVRAINDLAYGSWVDPRFKEQAAKRMAETRPAVLHGDFLACNAFSVMDRLPEIHVPTLILCGKEDKLTPLRYSEYLRDQIPLAELQVVERAGHMVMLEEPVIVAGVLADFLNKIPYQPGR